MPTVSVPSIEAFLAAVEAAEQRLVSGEAKARQAKALLLQAEKARDEAAARKAEAEQQLAPIEEALNKARTLRALVGEEVISQGEALLEETWAEAQAEVTRLQTEAEAAQAKVERLMTTPEVQAYLDYREAQERTHREARERERRELEVRLAALRPGAAVGQGTEPLAELAAHARKAGFPDLAAQALDAAEAARQVAEAQTQAERALLGRTAIHPGTTRRLRLCRKQGYGQGYEQGRGSREWARCSTPPAAPASPEREVTFPGHRCSWGREPP